MRTSIYIYVTCRFAAGFCSIKSLSPSELSDPQFYDDAYSSQWTSGTL